MNRWNEYGMYVFNEGRRFSRGERGKGQKREDFFCLYEGNWLGTKIDCIAVCVGFLFGKLIFLIIPDSVLFGFSSPLRTEITHAMISLFTNDNNIFTCYLPSCHQHISSSPRQQCGSTTSRNSEDSSPQLCAYLDRGLGS